MRGKAALLRLCRLAEAANAPVLVYTAGDELRYTLVVNRYSRRILLARTD